MFIFVKFLQFLNVEFDILMLFCIVTFIRFSQFSNALVPISIKFLGMSIFSKEVQP